MPSIKSFTMTYDALNEDGTFSEGDIIAGEVTLNLYKATTVQKLYIKAKGDADVRWTQKRGDRNHTYTAHKRYFKLKQFLIPEDPNDTVVPQGIHVYKFCFTIPSGSMPSSFTGAHGKIVYKLTTSLSRSWKLDSTVEKEIPFVSKSFPDQVSLMTHQVASKSKEIGLFSKGRVRMDVTVDKMGYAPGETVQIVAKINNSSSSEMTPKFCLIQDAVFHASSNTKHQSSVIIKAAENCIQPRTEKSVKCGIRIPRGQIQTINNCDIISVKYNLKVYLDISFSFDLEINFPVVILPLGLAPQLQGATAAGPYPAWATGGPSTSNFSPPAMSMGPSSPHSRHAYPAYQSMYAAQRPAYPAQAVRMSRDYNHPVPQPAGCPFSFPSSTTVLHPPPPAPAFHPPPSAPEIYPPPSSASNMYPTAPAYNMLPSAPMMNTDFLSNSDEPPPAYSLLFPSSDTDTSDGK